MKVLEILKWKAKPGVLDNQMIEAVNKMVPDIKQLKGFISQALYKDEADWWIDVYYWETSEDAHLSNELMEGKESLETLLGLIDTDTISMQVLDPLQSSD